MTFDFEWAELPDDIAHRKHQAWQEWEATDQRLHDPTHPPTPDEQAELEQRHRAAWKQYWHADGARYHLSNRQMGDAITVMEHTGMARRVSSPPFPTPADHGASSQEYDDWLDASDRGQPTQPSAELASYLDALDRHQRANLDAQVIPVHKLWTNDGWLLTPDELAAALPHAPASALDRRQRPIPWWAHGWTTWTPHEAMVASGSTSQRHPSTPDASTPKRKGRRCTRSGSPSPTCSRAGGLPARRRVRLAQ